MVNHIDPRSPTPIYAQIAAHVRIAVASGELVTGAPLWIALAAPLLLAIAVRPRERVLAEAR